MQFHEICLISLTGKFFNFLAHCGTYRWKEDIHFLYDASGYGLGCKPCHKGCTYTIFQTLFVAMVLEEEAALVAGRAQGDQLDLPESSPDGHGHENGAPQQK